MIFTDWSAFTNTKNRIHIPKQLTPLIEVKGVVDLGLIAMTKRMPTKSGLLSLLSAKVKGAARSFLVIRKLLRDISSLFRRLNTTTDEFRFFFF